MTKGKAGLDQTPDPGLSFEDRLGRLEEIVAELERGGESLERALELFEEGTVHMRALTAELERAQGRIDKLLATEGGTALSPLGAGDLDTGKE